MFGEGGGYLLDLRNYSFNIKEYKYRFMSLEIVKDISPLRFGSQNFYIKLERHFIHERAFLIIFSKEANS